MATHWECEQSVATNAGRRIVWEFWSDLQNHAEMEKVTIELDGPFQSGTKGRTISQDFTQEWELAEVREHRQFGIIGYTPDGKGSLEFFWRFEDEGDGTRITYRISARGPDVDDNLEILQGMGDRIPQALADLTGRLNALAEE